MRLALPEWPALAAFSGLVLFVTLYVLALSVHFPSEHRRASLKGGVGGTILWGTGALTVASAAMAVRLGLGALPGHLAVLAGGSAILAAPIFLKPLPDSLIDDRGGLLLFSGLATALALAALRI